MNHADITCYNVIVVVVVDDDDDDDDYDDDDDDDDDNDCFLLGIAWNIVGDRIFPPGEATVAVMFSSGVEIRVADIVRNLGPWSPEQLTLRPIALTLTLVAIGGILHPTSPTQRQRLVPDTHLHSLSLLCKQSR